ncbi:MAG: AraC family transcriptional regulator [Minicystis sp.]
MSHATASIKVIRGCALAAARRGISPVEVAARLGLDAAVLADPHARVPHGLVARAWEEIPALAGDPAFGLCAAEMLNEAPFDVVDHVAAQGPTLRDAVANLMRYQRLLHEDADVRLTIDGAEARMSQRLRAHPATPRHMAEFILAIWVLRARALTGHPFVPRRVSFQHGPPADVEAHRRLFGAPLDFLAGENSVAFPADLLERPVRGGDPTLAALLERHAADLLARLPRRDSVVARVKAHLLGRPPGDVPAIDATARALGLSARSLQRALQAEGTTYQAAVDDVRRDLSIAHLREPDRTISEIAFLVGFNEVGAFTRAFRRWTGEAPSAYRRREAPRA